MYAYYMYMYSNDIDLNWCMGWIEILNVEQQDWFSLGTPVSSTNITDSQYNWNIVESGVKHHCHHHSPNPITAQRLV